MQSSFLQKHGWSITLLLFAVAAKTVIYFLPTLNWISDKDLEVYWLKLLKNVFVSAIVFLIFRLIYKFSANRVNNIFDEQEERIFYSKIYGWVLFSIALLILLNILGLSLSNITLFIGIITTGLAFALREVLLSFIGWLILLRKKPFRIGDYIRIGTDYGKVVHIGTYYVILDKTVDIPDDFTRIPNRFFLEKSIEKLGKSQTHEKIQFRLEKMPDDKNERIERIMTNVQAFNSEIKLLSAHMDIENDRLYLNLNCMVPFEQKAFCRAQIVENCLKEFGDLIYFPKD